MKIRRLEPGEEPGALAALLDAARKQDGRDPLSDHKGLALRKTEGITLLGEEDGRLIALAQIVETATGSAIETVVMPGHRHRAVDGAILEAAIEAARPGEVRVWAFEATATAILRDRGARPDRRIAQLRRALPPHAQVELPPGLEIRPFVPGEDDAAWLAVNNEAFAGHPENGAWDQAVLDERMAQPWFDPLGFLLAEDERGIAGFCWTKLHPGGTGEIYIIAVADRAKGRGYGRQLALAGLWDLTRRRGARTAMLYAEVDNRPGRTLYQWLGFELARIDTCYLLRAE